MFMKPWYDAASKAPQATTDRVRTKPACPTCVEPLENRCMLAGDVVLHWNEVLMQSLTSNQHSPRVPLARNMALVHVAMFDAVNAIDRSYEPYAADVKASRGASLEAAAAQAAHDTLAALYPSRLAVFDAALAEDLAGIPKGRARQGIAIGKEVAEQILELRSEDGATAVVPYDSSSSTPGQWHPTSPLPGGAAAATHVPAMTPFALTSGSQFRPGPPPALNSPQYAAGFNEVKALGSADSTLRTPEQTQIGLRWRLPLTHHQVWNRIAQDVAEAQGTSLVENARAFALLNMAFNDGLQASFESKFHYGLWRPIEAIHRAAEDGNDATEADPAWMSLHPSAPPYPSYAGNAATIGAASATVLTEVFGDDVGFDIDWSTYGFANATRSYSDFWAAANEEARSRIYGGIHYSFDSDAGQGIGRNVGNYVMDNFLGDDAKTQVPFRGSLDGVVTVTPLAPPMASVNIAGQGKATQLGQFTVSIPHLANRSNGTAAGSYLFTAANGDTLTADFTSRATPTGVPGILSIVGTATITGGTGRFAGATGSFTIERLADTVAGTISESFEGTISTRGAGKR